MNQSPVIHWFRRDLRLQNNIALHRACATASPVIPLFIIDPTLMKSEYVGAARVKFLLDALRSLDISLQTYGSRLLIRHGRPEQVIPALVEET